MIPEFKNILIVRTDRVGDVMLTTPFITALRQAYPSACLTALVAPGTRELLDGNSDLNEILIDDRKGKHRGFAGFHSLAREIRKRNFDIAFVLHTKKRINFLCFWSGIPRRAGYRNEKLGFLLTDPLTDTRPQGLKHETEYCLDVLRYLGIPVKSPSPAPSLSVNISSQQWVGQYLKEQGVGANQDLIAIHPGASCVSKLWMPERFGEVADELSQRHAARVIFIGGLEHREIMLRVRKVVKAPIIDATGKTTLGHLAALFKRCRLLISNDSGPVHMSAALGIPVLVIFGRNQAGLNPLRWRPLIAQSRVIHKEVGCEVCLAHNCQINFKCLAEVSSAEVIEAANSLLSPGS